jgi:hypothetical protein
MPGPASLDFWREELQAPLSELFSQNSSVALSLLVPPKEVADDALKLLVRDGAGRRLAVVLCSNEVAPEMVARGMAKGRAARQALGDDLGQAVLLPLYEGGGAVPSHAILPYREPLSDGRLQWFLQRRRVAPRVLGWLAEAARATAHSPGPEGVESRFTAPLRHLAEMGEASPTLRQAAARTLERVEAGKWAPVHALMHNDLWKGNILLDANPHGFVLIDWPGSLCEGYAIYDLVRCCHSLSVSSRRLRAELELHCLGLGCPLEDARSHLCAGLAELSTRLEHFPVADFVRMADHCLAQLDEAGA